jgi:hypothetical protein
MLSPYAANGVSRIPITQAVLLASSSAYPDPECLQPILKSDSSFPPHARQDSRGRHGAGACHRVHEARLWRPDNNVSRFCSWR